MSARYTITVPPSRTVACKGCKRVTSKFAVYRAHDNRTGLCRPCVQDADGVLRVLDSVQETPIVIYGQCPTILPDGTQCPRSAGHKGDCRPLRRDRAARKVAA